MSQRTPIVLWNPRRHTSHATDDAGTSIKKIVLAPPVPPPPYTLSQPSQSHRVVPSLAYFCIRALSAYPDQLHVLGHIRIPYRPDILRALIPHYNGSTGGEARDMAEHDRLCLQAVDPRLWATIAQVMHPLPYSSRDLDLPLADLHLPLLQQIPSTPHFSLVTLVSLPCCRELCDETISALRKLNSLVALDLRGTPVSSYGVNVFARGLSWDRGEGRASRVGPWGLRILRLNSCRKVDNGVFSALHKFPLLSAVDLRNTCCTLGAASSFLADSGFQLSTNVTLFHPAPLSVAIDSLECATHTSPQPDSLYSTTIQSSFKVHVEKLLYKDAPLDRRLRDTKNRTLQINGDTVVFVPPVSRIELDPTSLGPRMEAYGTANAASTPQNMQVTQFEHSSDTQHFTGGGLTNEASRNQACMDRSIRYFSSPQTIIPSAQHTGGIEEQAHGPTRPVNGGSLLAIPVPGTGVRHASVSSPHNASPEEMEGHLPVASTFSTQCIHSTPLPSSLRDLPDPPRYSHPPRPVLSRPRIKPPTNDELGERLRTDPLALARPPPPWSKLEHLKPPAPSTGSTMSIESEAAAVTTAPDKSRLWLTSTSMANRARLVQRSGKAVENLVDQISNKSRKVDKDADSSVDRFRPPKKSKNPFVKASLPAISSSSSVSVTSRVGERAFSAAWTSPLASALVEDHLKRSPRRVSDAKRKSDSGLEVNKSGKSLKPITTLRVPELALEYLPISASKQSKSKSLQKSAIQSSLSFPRCESTPRQNVPPDGTKQPLEPENVGKVYKRHMPRNRGFDWDSWSADRRKSL